MVCVGCNRQDMMENENIKYKLHNIYIFTFQYTSWIFYVTTSQLSDNCLVGEIDFCPEALLYQFVIVLD